MSAKLTKTQLRALRAACAGTHTAYGLGRRTCEALRLRGLIEGDYPITKSSDPYITPTPAGRAALHPEVSDGR